MCANYRQALKILQTEPALKRWMQREGLEDYDVFHVWLEEEKEYLLGLDEGLPKRREETLQMEYVQKLVNLSVSEFVLCSISAQFLTYSTRTRVSNIRAAERQAAADNAEFNPAPASQVARRHAIEQRARDIELVEMLEEKLGVQKRWTSSSPEWAAAVKDIKTLKYQEALDAVEKVIISQLFEMTKMNQSGTGMTLYL